VVRDHKIDELLVVHQRLRARRQERRDKDDGQRGYRARLSGLFPYIGPIVASMIMPMGASMVSAM
jgi:hypothetical protein